MPVKSPLDHRQIVAIGAKDREVVRPVVRRVAIDMVYLYALALCAADAAGAI
jgi:hypothetical protein